LWLTPCIFAHANRGRSNYIGGKLAGIGSVDLVIADMPEDQCVLGLSTEIPEWNAMGDMYDLVLRFASRYLNDDGDLILLMPIGLLENLKRNQLLTDHLKSPLISFAISHTHLPTQTTSQSW
jgi:hypothetical protein